MKKMISMLLTLCVLLALLTGATAEGGRQTASAVLDSDGEAVIATVELTGGWSIEFASGAFYLYDEEITENSLVVAIGLTLDQEVYEENLARAKASDSYREVGDAACYAADGSTYYLFTVGDAAWFMLDVMGEVDGDAVAERVNLVSEREYYALDEAGAANMADFAGSWIAGRALLTIEPTDDAALCTVEWGNSAFDSTVWEYECTYDEVSGALTSLETGVKKIVTYAEGGEAASEEVLFDDGAASFALNDDGTLTWTDFKETPGENEVVFERAQGPAD